MIDNNQRQGRRGLHSRFGVMPRLRRHLRTTARPSPLRMVLFRAPSVAARWVTVHTPAATTLAFDQRSYVTVSPRVEAVLNRPRQELVHASPDASTPPIALSKMIEQTVRTVTRHSTRIERSQSVVRLSPTVEADGVPVTRAAERAFPHESAPRMVLVRQPEPSTPPALVEPVVPRSSPSAAFEWKPPAAADLAERVIREIDRRVVAERERLGRLR